jgi:DNA modification methylase
MRSKILLSQADALAIPLPANSVHCVVTSPPYWALRNYGVGAEAGELGLEPLADCRSYEPGPSPMTHALLDDIEAALRVPMETPGRLDLLCRMIDTWRQRLALANEPCGQCHVCKLVQVFREVRRVLHPSGTLWLNYGDVFAGSAPRGRFGDQGDLSTGDHGELGPRRDLSHLPRGVKKGDRLLLHARLALALQADGWWLRTGVIWHKPNPMPGPAQSWRRPVDSYELVYLLAKDYKHYFYDAEAAKEPLADTEHTNSRYKYKPSTGTEKTNNLDINWKDEALAKYWPKTRHKRDVWTIPTQGYPGAHFAVFPEKLVEPCVRAATSEGGVCAKCGNPWRRMTERGEPEASQPNPVLPYTADSGHQHGTGATTLHKTVETVTTGWESTCDCAFSSGETMIAPAVVLDPFVGSGTTVKVARDLGRIGIGLDISLEYLLNEACERLGLAKLRAWKQGRGKRVEDKDLETLPLFASAS